MFCENNYTSYKRPGADNVEQNDTYMKTRMQMKTRGVERGEKEARFILNNEESKEA